MAGFLAERYHVDLREAFEVALPVIKAKIRAAVERDIGGDEQRIISMRTAHREVTYKHVLLPVWISAFRFRDRLYRLLVNARTGEVQGERPWSVVKLVLTAIAIAVVVYVFRDPLGTFLRWVFILVGIFL